MEKFFDKLFKDKIVWAMHTAMTCDLAYVKALMDKHQGDVRSPKPQCAFFYDGNKQAAPTCKMTSPKFEVQKVQNNVFKLNPEQTHHAKISLVCYEKDDEIKYRLAVYSKNLEFSGYFDTALLFELEVGEEQTKSGRQLCAYLDKLRNISQGSGKDWLEKYPIADKETLSKITLVSEFGENRKAELYFGGCGNGTSLGSLLELHSVSKESIVLTPPVFIKSPTAQHFFEKEKPILYDHKEKPSHIKLYLLEKPGEKYELWVGSANATPNGLGWDFKNHVGASQASIECLVKLEISDKEFNTLSGTIKGEYHPYFDFSKPSNFEFTPDEIGPYIVKNFECEKVVYKEENKIKVTLVEKPDRDAADNLNLSSVLWRPLEYSDNTSADFTKLNKGEITYEYKELKDSQGILVFGKSCAMMNISDKLPENIERMKDKIEKDVRLTQWLLGETIPSESDKLPERLKWIRGVLLSGSNSLPNIQSSQNAQSTPCSTAALNGLLPDLPSDYNSNAKPMDFQRNGADRLSEIMQNNSRAFLADEPGLGKTFTAAMLVKKMAEEYYKDNNNQNKPFYVIYAAPNKTLINKCCRDLVKKFNDVSDDIEAVLLNDFATVKENLKRAYVEYYLYNECKEDVKKLLEEIYKIIDEYVIDTTGTTIASIKKQIVKKIKSDLNGVPPRWNGKLNGYYEKASDPDRLAYAHQILKKNGDNIGGKVVIIGVSAEVSLGEDSHSKYENKIIKQYKFIDRAAFTNAFLKTYQPRLIIWDEYHRYFDKLENGYKTFFEFEKNSDMKSLFVSATPYKTNISGKENEDTIKKLYAASLDDESPDEALPGFNEFAKLFCAGRPYFDAEIVIKAYEKMAKQGDKSDLEFWLKKRMIRNERTRLQGYYEEHIPLFNRNEQYDSDHAEILRNTAKQCRLLKDAGYDKGALIWSFSLPWMLCFSTSITKSKDGSGDTYFERLNPMNPNKKTPDEELFVYDDKGCPKGSLEALPKQNLAMHQICEKNLPDRQAAQLLWMPPTIPLYNSGENSIFTRYADYSKLLVFAEFRYLQRGGALLLSDYARLLCDNTPKEQIPKFNLKSDDIESFDFLNGDYRNKTLDEILDSMPGDDDTVKKLYQLASPAACAKKLKLDSEKLTNAFNAYFNSSGVKEALWSWLCDNGFNDEGKWEEGILRYCAEGNLYAVLEEWLLCIKENDPVKQMEYIISILTRKPSRVGVQTHDTTKKKTDGYPRDCGFAEQLTGDVGDVGTGDDEEATRLCSQAFDSPFYPMILFAGRGAQEGIDMHNYCLRIMHLTLPRGAVSYEQRNGRIDRYRSLLVRRRAAELIENMKMNNTSSLIERAFVYFAQNRYQGNENNNLYPNWSINNPSSKWHFEELMPVWEYTEESCFADSIIEMHRSYRNSLGVDKSTDDNHIDLSTLDP